MCQGFHANKHVLYQLNNEDDRSTQKDVNEDKLDDKHDGNGDCTALSEENHGVSMTEKSQADSFVKRFENHDIEFLWDKCVNEEGSLNLQRFTDVFGIF